MKKLVGIMLFISLLLPLLANLATGETTNEDAPLFTWNMSKIEVSRIFGTAGVADEETPRNAQMEGLEMICYSDRQISKFTAATFFLFHFDQLVGRIYFFNHDPADSTYRYLSRALNNKYGNANESPIAVPNLINMLFSDSEDPEGDRIKTLIDLDIIYQTWVVDDNTVVTLVKFSDFETAGPMTMLYFGQPEKEVYDYYGL